MKRPSAGYAKAYHQWTDSEELSDSAYRTLMTIYSLWNPSTERWMGPPTVKNVAKIRQRHTDTVKGHFQEIERAGFIKRTREPLIGGGSNMYMEIMLPSSKNPVFKSETDDSEGGENTPLVKVAKLPPSEGGENTPLTRGADSPPSISIKNGLLREDYKNKEREGTYDSVTDSQSETTRTKLPSAPSLSISDRVIGMINMAFPSNPNAVMTKIRLAGWDERRVEAALMKTDTTKGVNYFASICRGMSDDDIEKVLKKPEVRDQTSQQPERIMSKDGNSVKINGEWLKAATPYENMPLPPQHPDRYYAAGVVFQNRLDRAYRTLKIISKEDYLKLAYPPSFISRTGDRYTAGEISLEEYIQINLEEQKKYGITKENTE